MATIMLVGMILWSQRYIKIKINRYKEGLEICLRANWHQNGREYFLLFFPTRPSDEYDSTPSRKYSRSFFVQIRLYRLKQKFHFDH